MQMKLNYKQTMKMTSQQRSPDDKDNKNSAKSNIIGWKKARRKKRSQNIKGKER